MSAKLKTAIEAILAAAVLIVLLRALDVGYENSLKLDTLEERLTALELDHVDGMIGLARFACLQDPMKWSSARIRKEDRHDTYLRLRRECSKIGGSDEDTLNRLRDSQRSGAGTAGN